MLPYIVGSGFALKNRANAGGAAHWMAAPGRSDPRAATEIAQVGIPPRSAGGVQKLLAFRKQVGVNSTGTLMPTAQITILLKRSPTAPELSSEPS